MANFKSGYFVIPVDDNDNSVRIRDKFGSIRFSINPLVVTVMYVKVNVINIGTKSASEAILIDFISNDEAKKGLVELRFEMDKIKNRVITEEVKKEESLKQLDTGVDFLSIYETGTTQSSPTSSIANKTIDERITELVSKLSDDFTSLKDQKNIQISLNPIGSWGVNVNEHVDILGLSFSEKSDGIPNVYINGVHLTIGTNSQSISYLSDGISISNVINVGSKIYLNPHLLDYEIDQTDVITIHYLTY
jgi:hypothetical protein